MTALDIIKSSLRLIRVLAAGETPSADEAQGALSILNWMLDEWSNEGLMCFRQVDTTHSTVSGTASYTIGTGATWDTTRPIRIDRAFVRDGTIDYPLEMMPGAEYQQIREKTYSSLPRCLYYLPSVTTGSVNLWPVPDAVYTIGISRRMPFTQFLSVSADVELPPGYAQALRYALAVELAPEYGKPFVEFLQQAIDKKAILKRTNSEPKAKSYIDPFLVGNVQSDIYTDDFI